MDIDAKDETLDPSDITENPDHQEWLEAFWEKSEEEQMELLRALSMTMGDRMLGEIDGPIILQYGLGTWAEDGSFVTIGGANTDGYWNGRLLADAVLSSLEESGPEGRLFDGLVDGLLEMQHISLPVALALTERSQARNGTSDDPEEEVS
jgi:hypothetical protein